MTGLMKRAAIGAAAGMAKGLGDGIAARGALEGKAKYDIMLEEARHQNLNETSPSVSDL